MFFKIIWLGGWNLCESIFMCVVSVDIFFFLNNDFGS